MSELGAALEKIGESFEVALKSEQRQLLLSAGVGKHTLGVLPTGYGKSMAYGLFGPFMDKVS